MKKTKILSVADVIEAMATHRPYKHALNLNLDMGEIKQQRGTLYDPQIVDICMEALKLKDVFFE